MQNHKPTKSNIGHDISRVLLIIKSCEARMSGSSQLMHDGNKMYLPKNCSLPRARPSVFRALDVSRRALARWCRGVEMSKAAKGNNWYPFCSLVLKFLKLKRRAKLASPEVQRRALRFASSGVRFPISMWKINSRSF
jgi:hypothetical protein